MAINNFTGATNNLWGTATNWSQGTVPTATDGHTTTFDALSPDCTVDTQNRVCNNIDFTNYVNTITMTFGITVSGNITLGAGMSVAGAASTGYLFLSNTTASITSNGYVWQNNFSISGSTKTVTLLDDLYVSGKLSLNNQANSLVLNGFKIYVLGDFIVGTANSQTTVGTTVIEFSGSANQEWLSSLGLFRLPCILNKSGGTLTLGAKIYVTTSFSLTYTAGTVDAVTNSNVLYILGAITLNTNGISWNTIFIIGGAAAYNITLNSLLTADIIYLNYYSVSFIGTNVWTCGTFILIGNISAGDSMSLKAGSTYTINTQFRVYSSSVYMFLIKSGTPASVAYLVFNGGSNQKLINCDATDIDSSGGEQIWTLDGVLSNTTNWGVSDSSIPPVIISSSCC